MEQLIDNPFVGARSYEEQDQNIFFGREEEIEDLRQLVNINSFTLLYGKSGLGKTSLLQAGLFPILKKNNFFPIYIRPNYTQVDTDFIKDIEFAFFKAVERTEYTVRNINSGETLWEYFHNVPLKSIDQKTQITPVLVFDQFEEIFTLGSKNRSSELRDNITKMIRFIGELIENTPPIELGEEKRLELHYKYDTGYYPLKIVFSFREEYLSNFYSLSDMIPSIAYANLQYRLKPLTFLKGFGIIQKATKGLYTTEITNEILCAVTESISIDEAQERDVDSLLLSIFCEHQTENFRLTDFDKDKYKIKQISIQTLIDNIYKSTLEELNLNDSEKLLLEDLMLSPEGYRLPIYLTDVLSNASIRVEKINQLEQKKITKRYFIDTKPCIEIMHDKFATAIKQQRDFRREVAEKKLKIIQIQKSLETEKSRLLEKRNSLEEQENLQSIKIEQLQRREKNLVIQNKFVDFEINKIKRNKGKRLWIILGVVFCSFIVTFFIISLYSKKKLSNINKPINIDDFQINDTINLNDYNAKIPKFDFEDSSNLHTNMSIRDSLISIRKLSESSDDEYNRINLNILEQNLIIQKLQNELELKNKQIEALRTVVNPDEFYYKTKYLGEYVQFDDYLILVNSANDNGMYVTICIRDKNTDPKVWQCSEKIIYSGTINEYKPYSFISEFSNKSYKISFGKLSFDEKNDKQVSFVIESFDDK